MDVLLDTDARVAAKDRLDRCLDRLLVHKPALEQHLAQQWQDLFGATFDLLLYDLTSTYFEGDADAVPQAQRGCSRDHRPEQARPAPTALCAQRIGVKAQPCSRSPMKFCPATASTARRSNPSSTRSKRKVRESPPLVGL
jgi:hypothetical protein